MIAIFELRLTVQKLEDSKSQLKNGYDLGQGDWFKSTLGERGLNLHKILFKNEGKGSKERLRSRKFSFGLYSHMKILSGKKIITNLSS